MTPDTMGDLVEALEHMHTQENTTALGTPIFYEELCFAKKRRTNIVHAC